MRPQQIQAQIDAYLAVVAVAHSAEVRFKTALAAATGRETEVIMAASQASAMVFNAAIQAAFEACSPEVHAGGGLLED